MLSTGVWATRPRLHIVRKASVALVGGSPTLHSNGGATTHFTDHAFLGIGKSVRVEVGA